MKCLLMGILIAIFVFLTNSGKVSIKKKLYNKDSLKRKNAMTRYLRNADESNYKDGNINQNNYGNNQKINNPFIIVTNKEDQRLVEMPIELNGPFPLTRKRRKNINHRPNRPPARKLTVENKKLPMKMNDKDINNKESSNIKSKTLKPTKKTTKETMKETTKEMTDKGKREKNHSRDKKNIPKDKKKDVKNVTNKKIESIIVSQDSNRKVSHSIEQEPIIPSTDQPPFIKVNDDLVPQPRKAPGSSFSKNKHKSRPIHHSKRPKPLEEPVKEKLISAAKSVFFTTIKVITALLQTIFLLGKYLVGSIENAISGK